MRATMMDVPLTIGSIIEHANANNPEQEIVSISSLGSHRYQVRDFYRRVGQLASALQELGIKPGDRVASFAWNSHRHLELYFAVPMMGAVLHTVNIRLFPQQVAYVLDHAEDQAVFYDNSLALPLAKALEHSPGGGRAMICLGGPGEPIANSIEYEKLIADRSAVFVPPEIDEREAAALCYTTATTGEPKGVLYSHRSTVLHAWAAALPDVMDIHNYDVVLPLVPMFHVNAWGYPFCCQIVGAKLVFAGDIFDAPRLIQILDQEEVTITAGVPTIWMRVRDELKRTGKRLQTVKKVLIGGSAVPQSLLKDLDDLDLEVIHGFGMTETSPLISIARKYLKPSLKKATADERMAQRLKQGSVVFGVEWRALGEDGQPIPHDGKTPGELQYRGPWVTAGYYRDEQASRKALTADGWLISGDICTVDEHGFLQIVDRAKDVVKSGGEWISSVDLENAIMGHRDVKEAAVVGITHEKWMERPIAVVVLHEGSSHTEESIKEWLVSRVAKWWLPDRIVFVDSIPLTGVGKFLKRELRETYKDILRDLPKE